MPNKQEEERREREDRQRIADWNKNHPNAAEEYYRVGAYRKTRMIAEYFSIELHKDKSLTDERIKKCLEDLNTIQFIERMASKAKSWETCQALIKDPEVQNIVKNKGTGWEQYADERFAKIDEEATEIALGKKLAKEPQVYFKKFNKNHPCIEKEYYLSKPEQRQELLGEYLVGVLLKNTEDANLFALQKNVKQGDGRVILAEIAKKVQGWETCKEMLADKELQSLAANPDLKNVNSDACMKCAEKLTQNLQNNPTEQAFLESLPKPYDPALARQNVEAVRKTADALYASIEQVDFNLLGSGSKEFDAMKKSVKEFRRFAQEEYHLDRNDKISPDLQQELLKKAQESLQSVKKYLDNKQDQFDKDPARRNASGRQKHEQPRILTSIKLFEDLSKLHFEQSMTEPGREHKETRDDRVRKSEFSGRLHSAKLLYTINLASRQSKEKMDKQPLFNDQDKREAAKELAKQKKAEVPKGAKK